MPAPLIPSPEETRAANVKALPNNGGAPVPPVAAPSLDTMKTQLLSAQDTLTKMGAPPVSPAVQQAKTTEDTHSTGADALAGKTGSTNTQPPFISSSDSIEAKENDIAGKVNNLTSNNQSTTDAHNVYLSNLSSEMAALEARRAAETERVNRDFNGQEETLKDTQNRETGAETVLQQRSGGYLGQGASQYGALISLNQTHASEQAKLESARQAAIQAAQNAVDDKEFAVAAAQAKEAKDYAAAMKQNQQDYLDNQLKIQQAQENAVTASINQAKDQLSGFSQMSPADLAKVDPAQFAKIDQAYGVPGFAKSYLTATTAANAAKDKVGMIDAQQKLLTLLQDIPQGKQVSFADPSNPSGPGITYTGMGKVGDISTFQESDNYGNVTIVAYNKSTNTITRTAAGKIGKTSSAVDSAQQTGARLGYMDEFIGDPKNNILIPADPSNPNSPKYMTADNYVAMYQKYVKQYPGQGDEFIKQYPVTESVVPSQRKSTELNAFSQTTPAITK